MILDHVASGRFVLGRDVHCEQWRSYTRAHTGLGPGKSFEVNLPESSGVARNGRSRARPHENQAYLVILS